MEINKMSPVAVFAYNRPDHLAMTLAALDKCTFADETELYIFCDGPKNENVIPRVNEVRRVVKEYKDKSSFKRVIVHISDENRGLAKSIIEGVTAIITEYEKVIVVEDDLTCASTFLSYMNEALEFYKENSQIWSISGYSFPMKSTENLSEDVYFMGRASSWGWATWKDRWMTIDWDVEDYGQFKFNPIKRMRFSKWGGDLPIMLDQQMTKGINSWAIRWCYAQSKQGKWSVYPTKSLIINNGADGSGEHKSNTREYSTSLDENSTKKFKFCDIYYLRNIRKECRRKYNNKWHIFIRVYTKNLLIRIGLLHG